MRFHRISPCPKCGGKVKVKWEEQHYLSALVFRCGGCRDKPYAPALKSKAAVGVAERHDARRRHPSLECDVQRGQALSVDLRESGRQTMRDKAMPLGKKFKVRLTITPEETGTPVDMLGFTFTSGRNGRMELDTEYNNIPKLADDGLDSLSILVILKTLEMWAQKGYELFQPIAQRFHGGRR